MLQVDMRFQFVRANQLFERVFVNKKKYCFVISNKP